MFLNLFQFCWQWIAIRSLLCFVCWAPLPRGFMALYEFIFTITFPFKYAVDLILLSAAATTHNVSSNMSNRQLYSQQFIDMNDAICYFYFHSSSHWRAHTMLSESVNDQPQCHDVTSTAARDCDDWWTDRIVNNSRLFLKQRRDFILNWSDCLPAVNLVDQAAYSL